MRTAFVAFDDMTALDFVGAFDPLTRLDTMDLAPFPFEWNICARAETVTTTANLQFGADSVGESLTEYDIVVVPGGAGTRTLQEDDHFLSWLRTADPDLLASVCTGSLLLGAAGFLDGQTATTHPAATDELAAYCEVADERVVDEGGIVTARGVSSALDLGLYLVERLTDEETRKTVAEQMDYPGAR
ncbi:DJ-1/PfpI family protein [Halogeometricum borinquense]|uniref:DJ-1/PfpI family protein n=1 Tax=Halogeometricum borinquense TaxID=60847 RepID=A0A6C0UNY2_9EURY|nr:DJ-1/PfpI family protein [Halogeometricum borinquense]QIB74648.1 DJ-1/PfpI family protein [Halogeometricum borinquense]QIQ76399.1 DJ-1/PfpI family protein [Halogeometricum borinquense]